MHILTVETLKFGYPTQSVFDLHKILESKSEFGYLKQKLMKFPYNKKLPDIRQEISYVYSKIKKTKGDADKLPFKISEYKNDFKKLFIKTDKYDLLLDNLLTIVLELQGYYKRPQISQICQYFDMPIYPINSEWLLLPSYPNYHVVASKLIQYFEKEITDNMIKNFADNTILCGISYPTDIIYSYKIADLILRDNYFVNNIAKKYAKNTPTLQ